MTESKDALLVVLELHDEGLDVLALFSPACNGLLSVRVEVLFLLIDESLSLERISLVLLELANDVLVLDVGLGLLEVLKLSASGSVFLALLLFSELEFFVSGAPEFSEVTVLLDLSRFLGVLAMDLELARALNGSLHLGFPLLLLLVEAIGTVLGFSDLSVEDFLLVVLQGTKLFDLCINHLLAGLLLVSEASHLAFLLHVLKMLALQGESLNLFLLFDLLQTLSLLDLHELLVGLGKVRAHLSNLLLALDLTLLLALEILLSLALNQFAFEHLFLETLDELELVSLELLADVFSVGLLEFVLLFELGAHLLIVLSHLLLLNLDPVALDISLDDLLALGHGLLSLLLLGNIAHHHLTLKGLDHVLLLVHVFVGSVDLLSAELVLEVLLLSVESSTLNL